jgi:hypothetical protein
MDEKVPLRRLDMVRRRLIKMETEKRTGDEADYENLAF